ncbi:MAG TPA: SCO family protein [Pyrinomonadaceae bacterium]|nr:SCO family protein [Pyrinomonadaceae bacterium]
MKLVLICLIICFAVVAQAQEQTPMPKPKPAEPGSVANPDKGSPAPDVSPAAKYFSDVELINQDGEKVRFYSDVLKNKVVVINTFFTTCTSICPPMNRNFEKIQEALGDRLGKEAFLVSISVDPVTDTPTRLKEYGRRFHARPGWMFLTGKKENVDWALYKLGQYVETRDDHTSIFIIGNEPKGLWKKAAGLAKFEELIKIVEDVINDRM